MDIRVGTVYQIHLMLKFRDKEVYNIFNNFGLLVAILLEIQLSGLGKFLMGFAKMCF